MNTLTIIIAAAVLPAAILLFYIYKKDKYQPEPVNMILKGFGYGVASAFVSMGISMPLQALGLYSPYPDGLFGNIQMAFFGAAIPEEGAKLLMLWLLLRKNKYFDEHVDGIVYAVSISMGFAALENVLYLFQNYDSWITVGALRALISVPGHFAFAVFMGYYYSLAHFCKGNRKTDYMLATLGVPVVAHGLFDTLLFSLNLHPGWSIFVAVAFIALCRYMHIYSRKRIEEHLKRDREMIP